jgi:hypothetical protein
MRGWVWLLQLLLALASSFILRPEPHRTHNHILLSQIKTPPTWSPGRHIHIPRNRVAPLYTPPPGTGFPFHRLLRYRTSESEIFL